MSTFVENLKSGLNTTETWNGAKAYASTMNSNLDLFGKIGSSRADIPQAVRLFNVAYAEDPETATRILFYGRDVRGGQGERAVFRAIFKELVVTNTEIGRKLVSLIPFYGRWDDLLVLEDTSAWQTALDLIVAQLSVDRAALKLDQNVSLLAKWLPSINASSKDAKRLGRKIAVAINATEREYRKILTALRTKIKIVEQLLCSNEWKGVDYEHLPSRAQYMYRKAFAKHDPEGYAKYLAAVESGEKKINASTLYPYDIVKPLMHLHRSWEVSESERKVLNAQWNALPNYMEDKNFNGLVLCDVSGSMYSSYQPGSTTEPIHVAVALAIYIAERNNSPAWKDYFLAFASTPFLAQVKGADINAKVKSVLAATNFMGSTDLMAGIKAILDNGVKNKLSAEEMPQSLIVISDMQFNQACNSNKRTNFEQMQKLYAKAGYEMPSVIFWNVNAAANVPMTVDDTGTALVSGCSPSVLSAVLTGKLITPLDVMRDAVYTERYDAVGEVFSA
jgi:hypothetical protein